MERHVVQERDLVPVDKFPFPAAWRAALGELGFSSRALLRKLYQKNFRNLLDFSTMTVNDWVLAEFDNS